MFAKTLISSLVAHIPTLLISVVTSEPARTFVRLVFHRYHDSREGLSDAC